MIFYFSGTGNSLSVAKNVGQSLSLPIKSIPQISTPMDYRNAETVGLIFPVYAWGMPRMVEEFIKQLQLSKETYIFAIAVCAGNPAGTILACERLLKKSGGVLAAGFTVYLGRDRSAEELPLIARIIKHFNGPPPRNFHDREGEIVSLIHKRVTDIKESGGSIAVFLGTLLHPLALRVLSTSDRSFSQSSSCKSCGLCTKVCPTENIILENKKLQWLHNCEQCFACQTICSHKGITFAGTLGDYPLNKDIKREELLLR